MFDTVLVANRGEIAVRVIRTLRRLGVRSVAVHSPADADAPHVRAADTAVLLGDGASSSAADTYLSIERLLDAAARTGAEAVHPGYGFLAENAGFARACAEAGLAFIGPPPSAIELMGDKIHAKEAVRAAGVPVVPGSEGAGLDDAALVAAAHGIGLPVLLKPSAGGGGKGMRLIRDEADLADGIAAARREARASFGDDTLLLERWIDRPRHIEIQVLADAHGRTVHLGERECSLQRRHQKLIEEAPSVLLDPETRAAMGAAAVRAAASCGYTGAGTVEFIVPGGDPSSFYFMEMNTRLQVEHPVTELAVGIAGTGPLDLVEWQLRVAAGEPLPFEQHDVSFTGHAVEARVCAEDPARDFLPTGGRVLLLDEPTGDGVRVDSGLAAGTEVGTAYDPMLAKVVAHGPDRATALRRLRAALAETHILGVTTNTSFLRRLLAHPDVVSGTFDTGLIGRHPELTAAPAESLATALCAAALAHHLDLAPAPDPGGWTDPFSLPSGWRLGAEPAWTTYRLRTHGRDPVTVRVRPATDSIMTDPTDNAVRAGRTGRPAAAFEVEVEGAGEEAGSRRHTARAAREGSRLLVALDGRTVPFTTAADPASGTVWLAADGETWSFTLHDPVAERITDGPAGAAGGSLTAPMPGTVTVVKAAAGDRVAKGQPLLVLEAMKMEHVIAAPCDGVLEQVRVRAGSTVAMDELLASVVPAEPVEEQSEEQS